jgi:hypothetical protein
MGDGRILLKISAPLSLIINTYQMNLISAGSISLSGMVDKRKMCFKEDISNNVSPHTTLCIFPPFHLLVLFFVAWKLERALA